MQYLIEDIRNNFNFFLRNLITLSRKNYSKVTPDFSGIFENEEQLRTMETDQSLLLRLDGRLQNATARGKETDCVSRSFCPKVSVPEDPVCGSAHCQIADYWSKTLGKKKILAYQASKRGGYLDCEMRGSGRIAISGKAVLVAVSDIVVNL